MSPAQRSRAQLAFEYALAAFDADAVAAEAQRRAVDDPHAAYELEALLARRLSARTTHPDALAQTYWQMGLFANETAWRKVPGSAQQRAWLRRALADFEAAARLAPLSERYVIADANQADLLGDRASAARLFRQAAAIDPTSADAVAGLGVIAFENGDRAHRERLFGARSRARFAFVDGSRIGARSAVRVALDAQLGVGTATGIGEYVNGLAAALRRRGVDLVELREPRLDPWRFDRRVRWDQTVLPLRARSSGADVLHCASGTMPLLRPMPVVVTVHDVAWLHVQGHARAYARYYFGKFSLAQYRAAAAIVVDSSFSRGALLEAARRHPRAAACGSSIRASLPSFARSRAPRTGARFSPWEPSSDARISNC